MICFNIRKLLQQYGLRISSFEVLLNLNNAFDVFFYEWALANYAVNLLVVTFQRYFYNYSNVLISGRGYSFAVFTLKFNSLEQKSIFYERYISLQRRIYMFRFFVPRGEL